MTAATADKPPSGQNRTRVKGSSLLKPVPELVDSHELSSPKNFSDGNAEEETEFTRTCAYVGSGIFDKPVADLRRELWAAYSEALQQGHITADEAHSSLHPRAKSNHQLLSHASGKLENLDTVPWLPDVSLPVTRNRPSNSIMEDPSPVEAQPEDDVLDNAWDFVAAGDNSPIQVIPNTLFLLAIPSFKDPRLRATRSSCHYVTSRAHCAYDRSHPNFEPVSMAQVVRFCQFMSAKINRDKDDTKPTVYLCKPKPKHCTQAVFLLASYLVLECGWSLEEASKPFFALGDDLLRPFHNISFQDCIQGILKANRLQWLDKFDVAQYESLAHPANGSITLICPKFVAFKGPDASSEAECAAQLASTAERLRQLGVTAVVRLNDAEGYATEAFTALGMSHVDLSYEGYAVPPPSVSGKFLSICEEASGAVAVHCGLGGTGTLMALWMMRGRELSASEAMGFVRVMRPGCVVGKQHRLLVQTDRRSDALSLSRSDGRGSASPSRSASSNALSGLSSLSSSSSSLLTMSEDGGRMFRQASQRSFSSSEGVAMI